MKKLYKYIMILFVGIVALSSCVDDNDVFNVGEGKDVVLKLKVQTQANKDIVLGRAEVYENNLYDLHFYVFNWQGKLTGYKTLTDADTPTGTVTIPTKTGTSYIYAVANINNGSTYTLDTADKTLLNVSDVKTSRLTRDDLLSMKFKRTAPTGNQVLSPSPVDQIFMMSGYLNEGNAVTIQDDGSIKELNANERIIYLYRILAKNTFTIDLKNSPGFTPKSYKLRNIPLQGMLIRNADYIEDENDGYYDYNASLDNPEFVFYCPENKHETVNGITVWKDREANSYYGTDSDRNPIYTGNKVFTNAPTNSTYVEIQGDYYNSTTTTNNNSSTTTTTSGNVSYSIHLGNFDINNGGSYGDYNVIRNNHYKYKIIVNGVEDIIAEAVIENATDKDDNPYAEGLVIRTSTGQHYEVDAHYEARVMGFNMGDIWTLKSEGKGYILNIETPHGKTIEPLYVKYEDGVKIYTLSNNSLAYTIDNVSSLFSGNFADYNWMKFVKNTTSNVTKTGNDISLYTCKYPGDQNRYSSTNTGGWLNVFELLAELHKNASATNTGTVYYTCFIDENYYANMAWADYVNTDPRKMQIANNLYVSHDKNSIYADVQYSISQRSIATFYKDNSLVAFGTEIFDEEDLYHTTEHPTRLGSSNSTALYDNLPIDGLDDWDGFTSTKNTNINTDYNKWYENVTRVVTTTTTDRWGNETTTTEEYPINVNYIENIQPLYLSAAKACMSRNRDLNGNGNIDGGEVRWYLASGGQYHALYIAKMSLPTESWLITDAELSAIDNYYIANNGWGTDQSGHDYRGRYHYYTSSDKGTYWPEEGLTLNDATTSSFMQRAELVRCVRTLQSGSSEDPKYGLLAPNKYYTFQNNVFNLNAIETRRGVINGPLPNHNELQEQNELYRSFEVAADGNDKTASSLNNLTGNADDPCSSLGAKWRTPNQKELALMLAEMKTTMISGRYVPRTRFSGYNGTTNSLDALGYHWHDRVGFQIGNKGQYNLISNANNVKIRCVRDVN